ncbi:MAG: sulfotransferase family protein [Candidatus Omnitrophota bacterium]
MIAQLDFQYLRMKPLKSIARLISYFCFEGRPLLTRGRWINPFVFSFLRLIQKMPKICECEAPIYIVGMGRSGSTVLGTVLSMHRDVVFLNEPKALWHLIHSGEDLLGSYSSEDGKYRLSGEEVTNAQRIAIRKMYSLYLSITNGKRIIDKYPEMIFRTAFICELFPDAKFIFLIRNGWAVCNSVQQWSERFSQWYNGHRYDWWGKDFRKWNLIIEQLLPEHADLIEHKEEICKFTNQANMAAVEWIITMHEGLSLLKRYPGKVMLVRYEALTKNSSESLTEIMEKLQLSHDSAVIKYAQEVLRKDLTPKPFSLPKFLEKEFLELMREFKYQ